MHAVTPLRLSAAAVCALVWLGQHDPNGQARGPKACTIESANPIAFGDYDPIVAGTVDALAQITYVCGSKINLEAGNKPIPVRISLSTGASGTFDRRLRGGLSTLRYNVFLDAARTRVWGDGTGGSQFYAASAKPNGKSVTVPVFARLFGGQDVEAGTYLDNLVVTLDF